MERADIKLAIDMLDSIDLGEECEENLQLAHVINVLEGCGNEIASLKAQLADAKNSLNVAIEVSNERYWQLAERNKDAMRYRFVMYECDIFLDGTIMDNEAVDAAMAQKEET